MLCNFGFKCFRVAETTKTFLHTSARNNLQVTPVLCAEPLRKKKKIDPAILKLQTDRRKKRLEKQIKRAEKFGKKLKPVDELEIHREVSKDAPPRKMDNIEMLEIEGQMNKMWTEWRGYRIKQHYSLHQKFDMMIKSQELALHELKQANPQLYDLACQKDEMLLPFSQTGPVETPPIPNYIHDGKYTETTKSYELDQDIVKLMLDKNSKKPLKR